MLRDLVSSSERLDFTQRVKINWWQVGEDSLGGLMLVGIVYLLVILLL